MSTDGCASIEDTAGADPSGQNTGQQDVSSWKAESRGSVTGSREWRGQHGRPQRRRRVSVATSSSSYLSRTHYGESRCIGLPV